MVVWRERADSRNNASFAGMGDGRGSQIQTKKARRQWVNTTGAKDPKKQIHIT